MKIDTENRELLYDFLINAQKKLEFSNLYIGYQPDSFIHFNMHSEFTHLWDKFIQNDSDENNIGDTSRIWSLILNIKQIIDANIPGAFAEVGVYKGNTAAIIAYYANKLNRKTYLFDTFKGFNAGDKEAKAMGYTDAFSDTSLMLVQDLIDKDASSCEFIQGNFPDSIGDHHKTECYAVINLDCDLYDPMKAGLDFFYPRLSKGGIIFIHDYSSGFWNGSKKATDEFIQKTGENLILLPDKSGTAIIKKAF